MLALGRVVRAESKCWFGAETLCRIRTNTDGALVDGLVDGGSGNLAGHDDEVCFVMRGEGWGDGVEEERGIATKVS